MNRKYWRTTLGRVEYESNFLGMNGPRKFQASIPSTQSVEDFDSYKLNDDEDLAKFKPPLTMLF